MTKRVINGFTIIAHREVAPGDIIIMGHHTSAYSSTGHEYVVGRVSSLDDTEWYSGDYSTCLTQAVRDFKRRSGSDA